MASVARKVEKFAPPRNPLMSMQMTIVTALVVIMVVAWSKFSTQANIEIKLWALQKFQAPAIDVVSSLAAMEEGKAIPRILEIAKTFAPADRCAVLIGISGYAQGDKSNPAAKAAILAGLEDTSAAVRLTSISLVGAGKFAEATPKLTAILAGPQKEFAIAARSSLFAIGGPEATAEAKRIIALPVPEDAILPESTKIHYIATVMPALETLSTSDKEAALPLLRRLARFGLFPVAENTNNRQLLLQDLPISSARAMRESIDMLRKMKANDKETAETLKAIYIDPRRLYLRQAAERAMGQMDVEIPDLKKIDDERLIAERRRIAAQYAKPAADAAKPATTTNKEPAKP